MSATPWPSYYPPVNDQTDDKKRAGSLARAALSLAALWILAGALFKLLEGSPNDLPPIVRETLDMDLGLKYRLAIGIELAIAATALLRPGLGWLLVVAQLIVFDVVLGFSLDQESCGCFGSTIPITPGQMMAIDTVLLIAVLAGRPWRGFGGFKAPLPFVAGVAAFGMALPWILDRQVDPQDGPGLSPSDENGTGDGPGQGQNGEKDGGWVDFAVKDWEGKVVHETPLAKYLNPDELPGTGLYVLWRWTCDHCAEHLEVLAEREQGDRMIALIRLEEEGDHEGNRAVFQKPSGPFVFEASLPPVVDYVVTTPAELHVEGYTIQMGEEGVSAHDH